MTKRLRHFHKIDTKLAEAEDCMRANGEDIVEALQLVGEARLLLEEDIMDAQQYG